MSTRLLVFEFITGGGLLGEPLPESLRREGEMMRDALLADLVEQPEIEVDVMRDPRCDIPWQYRAANWHTPRGVENTQSFYHRVLESIDIVWPIAPETDGALEQLAATARAMDKPVMLSDAATLAICGSKYATCCALQRAGVDTVETFRDVDVLPESTGPWIVKPDDGAGAIGISLEANSNAALQVIRADSQYLRVLQPWCEGEALSLSLLCGDGQAILVSVNRQHVIVQNGRVLVEGLTVNALPRNSDEFVALGELIAATFPELWGYVGVDLMRDDDGVLRVLEINPRLTTSYCGLRQALGANVAGYILQLFCERKLPSLICSRNEAVELNLAMNHV
jgi:tyramine---L-glutamate ligase